MNGTKEPASVLHNNRKTTYYVAKLHRYTWWKTRSSQEPFINLISNRPDTLENKKKIGIKAIFWLSGSSLIGKCQNMEIDFFLRAWRKIPRWHNLLYTPPTLVYWSHFLFPRALGAMSRIITAFNSRGDRTAEPMKETLPTSQVSHWIKELRQIFSKLNLRPRNLPGQFLSREVVGPLWSFPFSFHLSSKF